MKIGFAILSHEGGGKLERLCDALNRHYGMPPIAVHHDFGQSVVDKAAFTSNVGFVEPHNKTVWAGWGTVQGALRALDLLYRQAACDWFFLLSASCYPVKTRAQVEGALAALKCDALLDVTALEQAGQERAILAGKDNPKLAHFRSAGNRELKRRFYTSRQFWIPIVRFKPVLRLGKYTWRPLWKGRSPYDRLSGYYGDFWFAGNAKAARILLAPSALHLELQRHLQKRTQADETYFQTVLVNEPGLTIRRDNHRYAEWNGGGRSPMSLTRHQLEECLASNAFFARKFAPGTQVTDLIDRHLLDAGGDCAVPADITT